MTGLNQEIRCTFVVYSLLIFEYTCMCVNLTLKQFTCYNVICSFKIQPNVHVLVGRKRKKDDLSSGDTGIAILYESCRSLQGTAKVTGSIN